MSAHVRRLAMVTALHISALGLTTFGCVDPEARYDAFLERSASMRGLDAGMVGAGDRFDWSGRYLLALSTSLAPDQPILFELDAEVGSDLTRIALRFQALTSDDDPEPRTPIGEPFGLDDVAYELDGTFSADLGEVMVPGRANAITGSDIVANVQLRASTRAGDAGASGIVCGQAIGMVTAPLELDLAGSTFGAVLSDDLAASDPLLRCP